MDVFTLSVVLGSLAMVALLAGLLLIDKGAPPQDTKEK